MRVKAVIVIDPHKDRYGSVSPEIPTRSRIPDAGRQNRWTWENGIMRRFFALLGIGLGILLAQPVASSAQTPDGVIELSGGSVAAGIGFTWGAGTLIFQGHRYPLTVSGLQLASVGISEYTAAGSVEASGGPATSTASTPRLAPD
jgi:hypothetical protein